jgi:hypothetical protein
MSRPKHRLAALLCATLLGAAPWTAAAEPTPADRNAARALAGKGADLFDAGNYGEAIDQFRQAEALVHAPPHLLYMARAYEKLGKLVEAHDAYDHILTDPFITPTSPPAFREAKVSANQEDEKLLGRIPTVKLTIASPDPDVVRVFIDGKKITPEILVEPILLNPGAHRIEATGRGLVPAEKPVVMTEGDRINVALSLRWQGPLYPAIIALGAGGLGLSIGVVTGAVSVAKVNDLADKCPDKHCLPSLQATGDSARTLGNVSTASFVVGGALIGAGVALAILRPWGGPPTEPNADAPRAAWVQARVGLGTVGLEGAF